MYGKSSGGGLDYNEKFAPVEKVATVRTFLEVASIKN